MIQVLCYFCMQLFSYNRVILHFMVVMLIVLMPVDILSMVFFVAAQLSQSAYFPLQLPYTVFGLGQTPNFVDELTVGVPSFKKDARKRTWTQIIPNSQLVVLPNPLDKPSSWTLQLYLTPSRKMMATGLVLLGTCLACALVVLVLYLLERREDTIEKQQASQKFHFDAM